MHYSMYNNAKYDTYLLSNMMIERESIKKCWDTLSGQVFFSEMISNLTSYAVSVRAIYYLSTQPIGN